MSNIPPLAPHSALLLSAEKLVEAGRLKSSRSILRQLGAGGVELPLLRRLNSLWRRTSDIDAGNGFDNRDWRAYGKPVSDKSICLTILDEISDLNWSTDFDCVRLKRQSALKQIEAVDYDFVLIETAWLGYESEWIYAFTAPQFSHQNAQTLVAILERLRGTSTRPIVMVNKEDPLYYDKFLPMMKYADHIFTTDEKRVFQYRRDTEALTVTALPFAANLTITNPVGRVNEQQEPLAFAGSFYSGGYEERARQMDYMLQPVIDFKGVIYDRQSAQESPDYSFPERFRPFTRPAVPFKEMVKLYRRFKVFLNVNTIVSSPSMMSRRVYELLASGTPVVSAPSRALEEHFPDIVAIATNARQASEHVDNLLSDETHWWKTSQKGIREIALKHQYAHRAALIRSVVWGVETTRQAALVSIIALTDTMESLRQLAEDIAAQTYPNMEVVLVPGERVSEQAVIEVVNRLASASIAATVSPTADPTLSGQTLDRAMHLAGGEFIAVFNHDSRYLPNYLTDMILTYDFSGASIAGKHSYAELDGQTGKIDLRNSGRQHSHAAELCISSLTARRSFLKQRLSDLDGPTGLRGVLATIAAGGHAIYSADHFNFIHTSEQYGEPAHVGAFMADHFAWLT